MKLPKPTMIDNKSVIIGPRKPHTYSVDYGMAFVTKDNKQVTGVTSCRDYMQDQVRTFLNNKKRLDADAHPYFPEQGDPDLCMSQLRLLISMGNKNNKQFMHGLSVLNAIEHYSEIPITIAEKVTMKNDKTTLVLLKGSGEYMNNPHLLSLVTLTMRFCFYNKKFKVKDVTSLLENYNKISPSRDKYLMDVCYNIMHVVLKRRKSLFEDLTPAKLFPTNIGYSFHSKGGIQQLCNGNSPNAKVNLKIKSLRNELKINN